MKFIVGLATVLLSSIALASGTSIGDRVCREGSKRQIDSFVTLICREGTFVPTVTEIVHRGCIEGEIAYSHEYTNVNSELMAVTLVCRQGRFVRY